MGKSERAKGREKRCRKCHQSLPLGEFEKHLTNADRLSGSCRTCRNTQKRKARRANIETYRARERIKARSPAARARTARFQQRRYDEHPERKMASIQVQRAIKAGRLVRQPCEVCGGYGEGHHDDYSKPLVVRWLCRVHHMEHHNGKK